MKNKYFSTKTWIFVIVFAVMAVVACDSSKSGHVNRRGGGGMSRGSGAAASETMAQQSDNSAAEAAKAAEAREKAEAEARAKAESDAAARAAIEEETGKHVEPKKEKKSRANRRGGVNQRGGSLTRNNKGTVTTEQTSVAATAVAEQKLAATEVAQQQEQPKEQAKEPKAKKQKESKGNQRSSLERKKTEKENEVIEEEEEEVQQEEVVEQTEQPLINFVVRGRVLDPKGRPVRGMQIVLLDHTTDVTVNNLNLGNESVRNVVVNCADTTDANGYFVVTSVSPMSDYMRVFVRDIDGPSHGNYKNDVINVSFSRFDIKDSGHGWRNGTAMKNITIRPKQRR